MRKPAYIEDIEKWSAGFSYCWPVVIRFSEIDMLGHLNNTVTFKYFEEARIHFLQQCGLKNDWGKADHVCVVADLQCDYVQQVYYGESLRIYVKTAKIGTSSCDLHYKAMNEKEEIVFTGRGTIVQIARSTGRPVPFNDETKKAMSGNGRDQSETTRI
jgi:acyl-CoA thioester hydrolase